MRMRMGVGKWLACLSAALLVIVGNAPVPGNAESEFDKWLRGAPYDEQRLLDEFDEGDTTEFHSVEELVLKFEASSIALILPLDADGFVAEAAQAFLEGFVSAAEDAGARFSLETYRTDGQPRSGLEAYSQAVINGAGLVVGPLLRSSVEEVARLPGSRTVPTILLQEPARLTFAGQPGAPQLYTFPLGGEVEIIQFADYAGRAGSVSVFVIVESSRLGHRLENTFQKAWRLAGNSGALVRTVVGHESWKKLHDELRYRIERPKKKGGDDRSHPFYKYDSHAVFAAGSPEFAGEVRANIPSAVPVFTLASAQGSLTQAGRNILGLSGMRFFEMPYLLDLRAGTQGLVAADYSASLPPILQRYVAAGIDAYAVASSYGFWGLTESFEYDGVTGRVLLNGGRFLRQGRLMELADGVYQDITVDPATLADTAE